MVTLQMKTMIAHIKIVMFLLLLMMVMITMMTTKANNYLKQMMSMNLLV